MYFNQSAPETILRLNPALAIFAFQDNAPVYLSEKMI
jgi:hypothetical protein